MQLRTSQRYILAEQGTKRFLVSPTSRDILKALAKGGHFSYPELSEEAGVPLNSLYVFCERLESAQLLKRTRVTKAGPKGEPLRVRTEIRRAGKPLSFPALKVIR